MGFLQLETKMYAIFWIDEEVTEFEYFGASLAAADFDHDGYEDLAIGVPGADVLSEGQPYSDAGAVYVAYGCSLGSSTVLRFSQVGHLVGNRFAVHIL